MIYMHNTLFGRRSYIIMFFTVVLLCFSIFFFTFLNSDVKKKEQKLAELNQQYESIVQENNDLNYLLNEADEKELFEQLARAHGYSYPDEKIYYDVTPGK